MKICYLYQYFISPKLPGATRSFEWVSRLAKSGYEVSVVTTNAGWMHSSREGGNIEWCEMDLHENIQIFSKNIKYSNYMGFFSRAISFVKFVVFSIISIIKIKPDFIYASSSPITVAIPALFGRFFLGIPFFFEVRDLWPDVPIAFGKIKSRLLIFLLKTLELYAYKFSNKIIALSPGMKAGIIKKGINYNKVHIVPNCCDKPPKEEQSFVKADINFNKAKTFCRKFDHTFGYFGTVGEANGVYKLVEFAEYCHTHAINVGLVIVGDGKLKPLILNKIRKSQLTNIILLPPVSKIQIYNYYQIVDHSFVTFDDKNILNTNSPNKFFDSISTGTPVISDMNGWVEKIINKHKVGLYVEKINKSHFVEIIHESKTQKLNGNEIKGNCLMLARTQFDRDYIFSKLLKIIQKFEINCHNRS